MDLRTDPINFIKAWLVDLFAGWGLPRLAGGIIADLLGIVILITAIMVLDILLVWVERKVVARFQDRLGPNRVGPFGLFQPFADIIKLIIKEDITPVGADKIVFNLAPILSLASVIILWAVVPIASVIYGADLNVALLYLIAAGAIGTLSIIMAGWSSNNKYALIGAYRMVATMISYEIPMLIMLLVPVIFTGSLSLNAITDFQAEHGWFFLLSPLGALIFLVAAIAELGRTPFDLNEGESEIVAGFHIEYTGMKFGLFYAGELLHAFTFGGFFAILFFGGWHGPFIKELPILGMFYFLAKALLGYWLIMWIKYTFMRIRIDQMLAFNWKFLTPLALVLLVATALVHRLLVGMSPWIYTSGLFLTNVAIIWVTAEILRAYSRKERQAVEVSAKRVAEAAHH